VINTAVDEGADPRQFARQMVEHLRVLLLLRLESGVVLAHVSEDLRPRFEAQAAAFSPQALARAVRLFNQAAAEAKGGWQPQLPLEMAFIEASLPPKAESSAPAPRSPSSTSVQPHSPSPSSSSPAASPVASMPAPARSASSANPQPQPVSIARELESADHSPAPGGGSLASLTAEALRDRWAEFLNALRPRNLSLEALMRSCRPVAVEGDVVVLGFDYDFHRGKVEEERNKRDVEEALSGLVGQGYRVRCVLARGTQKERAVVPPQRPAEPIRGEAASPAERTVVDDPVVRAAVELGAKIVPQGQDSRRL
jgi:DNA polymerase-3 subunit gamma/tau